jgi:hypothetical protein
MSNATGPFYRPDGDEYVIALDGAVRFTGFNAFTNPRPVRKAPKGRGRFAGV